MLQAYRIGLYGPKIVWILPNWFSYDWWRPLGDVSCTLEEMVQATEGVFLMGSFVRNHIEERGIAELTGKNETSEVTIFNNVFHITDWLNSLSF